MFHRGNLDFQPYENNQRKYQHHCRHHHQQQQQRGQDLSGYSDSDCDSSSGRLRYHFRQQQQRHLQQQREQQQQQQLKGPPSSTVGMTYAKVNGFNGHAWYLLSFCDSCSEHKTRYKLNCLFHAVLFSWLEVRAIKDGLSIAWQSTAQAEGINHNDDRWIETKIRSSITYY